MKQLIVGPDPLILARKWLALHIDAPVFGERPARLPSGPFVILRESGGGRKRALVISPFYFAVEVWHDTTEAASELASRVAAAFDAWTGETTDGVAVYTSAAISPVYNPDAETRRARYTFAADGTLRATVEPLATNPDKE